MMKKTKGEPAPRNKDVGHNKGQTDHSPQGGHGSVVVIPAGRQRESIFNTSTGIEAGENPKEAVRRHSTRGRSVARGEVCVSLSLGVQAGVFREGKPGFLLSGNGLAAAAPSGLHWMRIPFLR